jgi:hypothetical protein
MTKYYAVIGGSMVVAGPFNTYGWAQDAAVKYARANGLQMYQVEVKEM